jgi:hypothetical protein
MTTPPPALPYVTPYYDRDAEHLRLLSIFWYILAGLQCLGACVATAYILFGILFAVGGVAAGSSGHNDDAPPAAAFAGMGGLFACFGVIILVIIGTLAFLDYKTGQSLVKRKNLTLIYIMAALSCLGIPTIILGIFTFIVVSRPSVKASFT